MNQSELFKESLKHYANFLDIPLNDLSQIGTRIGSNIESFKRIYQSYLNKKDRYEFEIQARFGLGRETIEAKFDLDNDEITVTASAVEIKVTKELFLKYMNLIDLCFSKILPIGSVIQLDLDMMPEDFRESFGGSRESMFTISGRKIPIQGELGSYYIDYIARLFPLGESELAQPFLISNMMIKNVISEGFSNELEMQFVDNVLRQDVINEKGRGLSYLLDNEVEALEQVILQVSNPEGEKL
jgi:hypothetical protein